MGGQVTCARYVAIPQQSDAVLRDVKQMAGKPKLERLILPVIAK